MKRRKHRQQLHPSHLFHIVHYLKRDEVEKKSRNILVRQRTTSISYIHPTYFIQWGPHPTSKWATYDKQVSHTKNITKHLGQPYLFLKKSWLYCDQYRMRTNWWSGVSSMGSGICHTSLNSVMMGSISVDVVVWMMLILLNGENRISEESHSNDVG